MALPGALLPWVELRFLKTTADGLVPNDGGFVRFTLTGTAYATLEDTFSDSGLTTPNANPVELDADGRPPDPIYLSPIGYSVQVYDADMVLLYSIPYVADVAAIALSQQSVVQSTGVTVTTSPYVVPSTVNLVNIASLSSGVIQLPAAADRPGIFLVIKNSSNFTQAVTPAVGETIDLETGAYDLPVQANPNFPTAMLASDGVSNWFIIASHFIS